LHQPPCLVFHCEGSCELVNRILRFLSARSTKSHEPSRTRSNPDPRHSQLLARTGRATFCTKQDRWIGEPETGVYPRGSVYVVTRSFSPSISSNFLNNHDDFLTGTPASPVRCISGIQFRSFPASNKESGKERLTVVIATVGWATRSR
jgi:hypothetical protein